MPLALGSRTAIVTGASSGIGKSIAIKFSAEGAHVHLFDINADASARVKDAIVLAGGKCTVHHCNVANQKQVISTIDMITAGSSIDILVNNAGIGFVGNVEQTPEADLDRLYQVNVKGVYNCLYAIVPHMKSNGGGVILNMASVAATVGIPDRFAYSMTKGAVLTMTYSIACDYVKDGIRCNSISPGRVHTPFVDSYLATNYPGREKEMFQNLSKTQPIGRMGTPEEIAGLATYLCSDQAAFITGTDFPIDGGFIKLKP